MLYSINNVKTSFVKKAYSSKALSLKSLQRNKPFSQKILELLLDLPPQLGPELDSRNLSICFFFVGDKTEVYSISHTPAKHC